MVVEMALGMLYLQRKQMHQMATFLDTIKKAGSSLFKQNGESVLGIDISSSTIKVVQVSKQRGRAVLETYGELALGPYAGVEEGKATLLSPEKLGQALADLMVEAKITTRRCGVAMPLASSLINVIQMPDIGEKQLKDMVPIEVRKYVPVNISEVMLDWRVIPKIGQEEQQQQENSHLGKVDVLTVAIHKDTITRYQKVVESAQLQASFFEIEVFSTIRSVLEGDLAPTMIIGFGAGTTKVYIVDKKVLRESHSINRGAQDITNAIEKALGVSQKKAEEMKRIHGVVKQGTDTTVAEVVSLVLDSILAEAKRIMMHYQKKEARNISKVILAGGGALLPGLVERTAREVGTEVVLADPFGKVQTPAFLEDVLHQVGPEFSVALGVALRKLDEEG